MSIALPIIRSTRRRDLPAAAGQTVFTLDSPVFDLADVAVFTRLTATQALFTPITVGFTLAFVAGQPGSVQATFALAPKPTSGDPDVTIRIEGKRVAERTSNATRSGVVQSVALEADLDKIATVLQELRRDIDDDTLAQPQLTPDGLAFDFAGRILRNAVPGVLPTDIATVGQVGSALPLADTPTAIAGASNASVISPATLKAVLAALNQVATGHFWSDQGGQILRINDRIMLGGATINDGKAVPIVKDWLETERANTTKNAQLAVLSTIGQGAILGGVRSSDFGVAASEGAIAIQGWAINDDASHLQAVYAAYFEARRKAGAGTAHGMEIDIVNQGSVVDLNPYSNPSYATGLTDGIWLASGGGLTPADASVGIFFKNNTARFRKGIIFDALSLTGTDGTGTGNATAIELARGHVIQWLHANGGQGGTITSNVSDTGPIHKVLFSDIGLLLRNTADKNALQVVMNDLNVNGFVLTPSQTGVGVSLGVAGDDANVALGIASKGTGVLTLQSAAAAIMARFNPVASSVNFLDVTPNVAGGGPALAAAGGDTNIDLGLASKGTGVLRLNNAGMFAANGAVATTMTSLGPTGSHTTIQEWLMVKNGATVRWIPCY